MPAGRWRSRSEEHTSELQSHSDLVCRLLLEKAGHHRDLHSFPTRRSSDLAHVDGYVSAIEWRFLADGDFDTLGPGAAWARQRIPLIDGEPDTGLTRVLTIADACWAVAFKIGRAHV